MNIINRKFNKWQQERITVRILPLRAEYSDGSCSNKVASSPGGTSAPQRERWVSARPLAVCYSVAYRVFASLVATRRTGGVWFTRLYVFALCSCVSSAGVVVEAQNCTGVTGESQFLIRAVTHSCVQCYCCK